MASSISDGPNTDFTLNSELMNLAQLNPTGKGSFVLFMEVTGDGTDANEHTLYTCNHGETIAVSGLYFTKNAAGRPYISLLDGSGGDAKIKVVCQPGAETPNVYAFPEPIMFENAVVLKPSTNWEAAVFVLTVFAKRV